MLGCMFGCVLGCLEHAWMFGCLEGCLEHLMISKIMASRIAGTGGNSKTIASGFTKAGNTSRTNKTSSQINNQRSHDKKL